GRTGAGRVVGRRAGGDLGAVALRRGAAYHRAPLQQGPGVRPPVPAAHGRAPAAAAPARRGPAHRGRARGGLARAGRRPLVPAHRGRAEPQPHDGLAGGGAQRRASALSGGGRGGGRVAAGQAAQAGGARGAPGAARGRGGEAAAAVVAGADRALAPTGVPRRPEHARVARGHLPVALCTDPRGPAARADPATAHGARDAVPARRPHPRRPGARAARRHGVDPRAPCRARGPRSAGALGGRPRVRPAPLGGGHPRGAHEPLPAALPGARRLQGRADARGARRRDHAPARAAAALADVGPRQGDERARALHRGHRRPGVLLRSAQPVAARHQREHQREHQRAAPAVPAQGRRPADAHPGRPRRGRRGTQRAPTRDARLAQPGRALPGAGRGRV
ncbi:MAG: Mobile element protein, partial [uncultured Gemmatimonadaceae bacterium]